MEDLERSMSKKLAVATAEWNQQYCDSHSHLQTLTATVMEIQKVLQARQREPTSICNSRNPNVEGTLNYSCFEVPTPTRHKERRSNESVFDVCFWVDCGGSSCNKTSSFSYGCYCDAGYYDILNAIAFPCIKECAFGIGCSNLGISMTNSSTATPPPALVESGKNEEDVCKEVQCGKGTCKPSKNSTFLFECECNPSWKQTLNPHTEGSNLGFICWKGRISKPALSLCTIPVLKLYGLQILLKQTAKS